MMSPLRGRIWRKKMRIVLCDSDKSVTASYRKFVESRAQEMGGAFVEEADSCEKLLFELSDEPNEADVIITDTVFEGKMDGIEAMKQLRDIGYIGEVIFLTNEKERVFESFDVRPCNYLLKQNVSLDKFATVLEGAMLRAKDAKRERLTLACAGDVRNIPIDEIVYFEVSDRIVEVHYSGEVFEFYSTLDKIENQLYGRNFIRSHRSFLVNAEHIDIVRGNEIVMDSGDIIPIGSKYAKYFSEVNTQ